MFIFRPIWLNEDFSFLTNHLGRLRNFFQVGLREKNLLDETKSKFLCLSTLFQGYLPFIYGQNLYWKIMKLQCKTNFFIHLCSWGTYLLRIKELPSWEASIDIKKRFLDLFTLVHIHLNSSTFIYTHLHSCRLV